MNGDTANRFALEQAFTHAYLQVESLAELEQSKRLQWLAVVMGILVPVWGGTFVHAHACALAFRRAFVHLSLLPYLCANAL